MKIIQTLNFADGSAMDVIQKQIISTAGQTIGSPVRSFIHGNLRKIAEEQTGESVDIQKQRKTWRDVQYDSHGTPDWKRG